METKYKVGDKVACAVCCGGHHTPCPPNLLGEVRFVKEPDTNNPHAIQIVKYMIRLPSGMMDWLWEDTARTEKPDPSRNKVMRHALGN